MRKVRQIEPPESTEPFPARVSIIDYGEGSIAPVGRPLLPRRISELLARQSPRRRRAAGVLLVFVLAGAATASWTLGQNLIAKPAPSSSPSPSLTAVLSSDSGPASDTFPGYVAYPSEGTPLPIVPRSSAHASSVSGSSTWPVSVPTSVDTSPVQFAGVGPDGTLYATSGQIPPIDSLGRSRTNWLRLQDGTYLTPTVFGSDGSLYGPGPSSGDQKSIYAYTATRQLRYAVATRSVLDPILVPGPGSTLYMLTYDQNWPNGSPGVPPVVLVLDAQGQVTARWRLGGLPLGLVTNPQFFVRSDGDIVAGYIGEDGCGLHVISESGEVLASPDSSCWDQLEVGPDGTLAAWSYDSVNTQGGLLTRQTRLALLDQNGEPLPGWPVTVAGAASRPVLGSDGRLYVNDLISWAQKGQVVAFERSGKVASGWPVELSDSSLSIDNVYPPGVPDPPVVTPAGDVFACSTQTIAGYDRSGRSLPGWPVAVTTAWAPAMRSGAGFIRAPVFYSSVAGGRLYIALSDRILALTMEGRVASGWPYSPGDGNAVYWNNWATVPNDGLLLISDTGSLYDVVVLGPDGAIPD